MFKRGGSGEGNSNPGAVATARKASQSLSFSQHLLRGWSIDLCTVGWPLNQPLIFWQKVRSFFTFCKIKTNWRQQDPLAAKVYFPASFFLNNKRERGIITQEMKRRNLVPTSTTVFTVHIRPYLLWLKEYKRNRSGLLWNSDVIAGIPYLSPVWTYSSFHCLRLLKALLFSSIQKLRARPHPPWPSRPTTLIGLLLKQKIAATRVQGQARG